jgi:hypothetical protein
MPVRIPGTMAGNGLRDGVQLRITGQGALPKLRITNYGPMAGNRLEIVSDESNLE